MRIFFLKDGKWQDYRKELLEQTQAYNFVAWTRLEIMIVAPTEIRGNEFHHKNAAIFAMKDWIVGEKDGEPDVSGVIGINSGEENQDNCICQWTSEEYGETPEDLRPPIREALGLQDVVYA